MLLKNNNDNINNDDNINNNNNNINLKNYKFSIFINYNFYNDCIILFIFKIRKK